jgi:predicted transcriptional regulator
VVDLRSTTTTTKIEAANWLNVSKTTVLNYIKSGKALEGKYLIRRSSI